MVCGARFDSICVECVGFVGDSTNVEHFLCFKSEENNRYQLEFPAKPGSIDAVLCVVLNGPDGDGGTLTANSCGMERVCLGWRKFANALDSIYIPQSWICGGDSETACTIASIPITTTDTSCPFAGATVVRIMTGIETGGTALSVSFLGSVFTFGTTPSCVTASLGTGLSEECYALEIAGTSTNDCEDIKVCGIIITFEIPISKGEITEYDAICVP